MIGDLPPYAGRPTGPTLGGVEAFVGSALLTLAIVAYLTIAYWNTKVAAPLER